MKIFFLDPKLYAFIWQHVPTFSRLLYQPPGGSDCSDHIYQYAKFGACFQKCTNIVLSHWTKKNSEIINILGDS